MGWGVLVRLKPVLTNDKDFDHKAEEMDTMA